MAVDLGIVRALVESRPHSQCLDDTCADAVIDLRELPAAWRYEWLERAAILEYDGGLSREEADRQALREVAERCGREGRG